MPRGRQAAEAADALLSRPTASGLADDGVGGWEEDALVTVLPVHDVWRAALLAVDLDDLTMTVPVALMAALDCEFVSDRCFHGSPSLRGTWYLPGLSAGQSSGCAEPPSARKARA